MKKEAVVYVLELANAKYYVGSTEYLELRLRQHYHGVNCAKWTTENKMQRVLWVVPCNKDNRATIEEKVTLAMMREYGVCNVRGGGYVLCFQLPRVDLSHEDFAGCTLEALGINREVLFDCAAAGIDYCAPVLHHFAVMPRAAVADKQLVHPCLGPLAAKSHGLGPSVIVDSASAPPKPAKTQTQTQSFRKPLPVTSASRIELVKKRSMSKV